jgi:hypothetical protein
MDGGSGVGGVEAVSFPDAWHIAGKAKVSGRVMWRRRLASGGRRFTGTFQEAPLA